MKWLEIVEQEVWGEWPWGGLSTATLESDTGIGGLSFKSQLLKEPAMGLFANQGFIKVQVKFSYRSSLFLMGS